MTHDSLNLGLIGVGSWGRNYIHTINSLEEAKLVVVLSRYGTRPVALTPDCRVVTDWSELALVGGVDGVIIASPPAAHAETLIAAIAAGIPVLVEKPLTHCRADGDRIRSALGDRKAIIRVEHTHLHHPAFRALQAEAATLGAVRSIASSAGNIGPYRKDVSVLWDWGAHDLAMCLTLVPGEAHAERLERLEAQLIQGVMAERLMLSLRLADDIPAEIMLSTLDPKHRWFAATFDDCTLVYRDAGKGMLMRYPAGADIHSSLGVAIEVAEELPLTRAVLDFVDAIRRKDYDQTSLRLGLRIVDLLADFDALTERSPSRRIVNRKTHL